MGSPGLRASGVLNERFGDLASLDSDECFLDSRLSDQLAKSQTEADD
jgi:hypothetical protein